MGEIVYLAEENLIKALSCANDASESLANVLDKVDDPVVLDATDSTEEAAKTEWNYYCWNAKEITVH